MNWIWKDTWEFAKGIDEKGNFHAKKTKYRKAQKQGHMKSFGD